MLVIKGLVGFHFDPRAEARVCLVHWIHDDVNQLAKLFANTILCCCVISGELTQQFFSMAPSTHF